MVTMWNKQLAKLLYLGGPLVSIFLIDEIVTDPVNAPKLFILGVVACGVLGAITVNLEVLKEKSFRVPLILTLAFLMVSVFVLICSKGPITQSIYGVYGRNNGFLAYIFLSLIFLGAIFLQEKTMYKKIYFGILVAGLVNVFYCTWVTIFGDFLSWSNPYGNVLGTFGNPNFIGAFLGMFTTGWIALVLAGSVSTRVRLSSLIVLPLAIFAILESHAIQGRVLLLGGASLVFFYWIKSKTSNKFVVTLYLMVVLGLGSVSLAGAFQRGPLTEYIYKTSVSLRGQYWLSGWNTGKTHLLSGVGFDGLGDWYRRMRDIEAITLPGPNTVVNAAHNVPLDLFAFGGAPLFAAYILIVFYTGLLIAKNTFGNRQYDPIFVGISSMWVCYQIQSLISINQLGLAVWGWLLSGTLIGYVKLTDSENLNKNIRNLKKQNVKTVRKHYFGVNISIGIGMLVGALVALPPLSADIKWRTAQKSGNLMQIEASLSQSYLNPQNNYKYLSNVLALEQSNLNDLAYKYVLEGLKFNPDNFDLWRALYILKNSSPEDRLKALKRMKVLDPLNPDVTK